MTRSNMHAKSLVHKKASHQMNFSVRVHLILMRSQRPSNDCKVSKEQQPSHPMPILVGLRKRKVMRTMGTLSTWRRILFESLLMVTTWRI
jgi:hypothetical protein